MADYSFYYRRAIGVQRIGLELPSFDIFISAYNSSDRVKTVFSEVKAQEKHWLLHPEYAFPPVDEPAWPNKVRPSTNDEVAQVRELITALGNITGKSICIDTTGFMRHVLVFLAAKLAHLGVREFTALYSEPMYYAKQENTAFSTTTSGVVRPVRGMGGSPSSQEKDFLILNVGYDHKLIGEVTNYKDSATVYPVFSFPSLSPDMYQQSAIRAADSGEVVLGSAWTINRRFAPANDPFATAQVVSDIVGEIERKHPNANIYLSPLSTKIQALGVALYWLKEGQQRRRVSVLLPECGTYSRETSTGLKRLWTFTVEV